MIIEISAILGLILWFAGFRLLKVTEMEAYSVDAHFCFAYYCTAPSALAKIYVKMSYLTKYIL